MKIAVYTAIMGLYDIPKPVKPEYLQEADFFLFSDNMGTNLHYKTINVEKTKETPMVRSRRYKMMPHKYLPDYDYHIYVDGSIELLESPKVLVEKYLQDKDIALFNHPYRYTLFEELYYCFFWKPDIREQISGLMTFLLEEMVPEDLPLTENCFLIRKNTHTVRATGELWWDVFSKYPSRDQLILPYCLWKLNMVWNTIEGLSIASEEIKLHKHI